MCKKSKSAELQLSFNQALVISLLAKHTEDSIGIEEDVLYQITCQIEDLNLSELVEILSMLEKNELLEKHRLQTGSAGPFANYYRLTEDTVFTATLKKLPKTESKTE